LAGRIFTAIRELKEVAFAAVVPRKIKKIIEDILTELRNLPARVKSYASYESTLAQVQEYKEASKIVMTLKSEALKERHWKVLLKKLRIETIFADLTLGLLFELDLPTKSSIIDSVMLEAGDGVFFWI
jgi:dynein heavy chain 1